MLYSEVVELGLILPKKNKYTLWDVNNAIIGSLFSEKLGQALSNKQAVFIVKCSAIYHGTDYSKTVGCWSEQLKVEII